MPSKEVLIQTLGLGVIMPALVTALVILPLRLRPALGDALARLLGGLAIGLGFFAGYVGLGFAPLKPEDPWHWLPWLGIGAAILGSLHRPFFVALLIRAAAASLAAWLLVPTWESTAAYRLDVRVFLGLVIFLASSLDRPLPDRSDRTWPVLLTLTAVTSAFVLMQGGSAKLAQLAGALVAALAAVTLVLKPGRTPPPGVLPVVAVLLPGLLASGFFDTHSEVPRICYLLPAVAVVMLDQTALAERGRRLGPILLILALLALAVGLALWAEPIEWKDIFSSADSAPITDG